MKTNRLFWAAAALIILCVLACRGNLEVRKRQSETMRNLGEVLMGRGDYISALREFLKAEKIYPDDPYLQNDLGLVYKEKKRYDLAIHHFNKALALKPSYADAKNNLGTVYMAQEDWDAAIATFKEITGDLLYATPQNPLFNLGLVYYHKNEYGPAEKYFNDCLKYYHDGFQKDITYIKTLYRLGRIYLSTERVPQAVSVLEKAIQEAPRAAELYLFLGNAHILSRDYQKGLNAYNKVIELAPDTPLAQEAKEKATLIKNLNPK
ncbi:tetratricopeptide repeat protein [Thermodesulfobacteriota bacterium]